MAVTLKPQTVPVFAVVKDVNYSTLPNMSSEENPFKPVTSDVTRRAKNAAKRARQRSAKYETAAAVEMEESVQDNEFYEATAKETEQHALEAAMVEVENSVKQSKVEPATGRISPQGGTGGQGGGAIQKEIPKSAPCGREPCQKLVEDVVLMNHKQGEQHHWQELRGNPGGRGGGAKQIPKTDPLC